MLYEYVHTDVGANVEIRFLQNIMIVLVIMYLAGSGGRGGERVYLWRMRESMNQEMDVCFNEKNMSVSQMITWEKTFWFWKAMDTCVQVCVWSKTRTMKDGAQKTPHRWCGRERNTKQFSYNQYKWCLFLCCRVFTGVFWGGEQDGLTLQKLCHNVGIWKAWFPCASCSAGWVHRSEQTSNYNRPRCTCTVSRLCESSGEPSGVSSWCRPCCSPDTCIGAPACSSGEVWHSSRLHSWGHRDCRPPLE